MAIRIARLPDMQRVAIGVDPSGTSGADKSNSVGIIAAGLGVDNVGYILADYTCSLGPMGWARRVVECYHTYQGDRIVAEKNFGGAMVESTIRTIDASVPIKLVTASRGKIARAEPVAALYEQCIAGDSLIACERGMVPVREVCTRDRVWTREGLKQVLWAGQTGIRETVAIKVGGNSLRLTHNHPVLTMDGWVHAGHLAHKERMLVTWMENAGFVAQPLVSVEDDNYAGRVEQNGGGGITRVSFSDRLSSSAAFAIFSKLTDIGGHLAMAVESFCTALFGGHHISVGSLPGGTSTTRMETSAITTPPILWLSLPVAIRDTIIHEVRCLLERIDGVLSVGSYSIVNGRGSPFVASGVDGHGMRTASGGEPVYNLHVEGKPEYIANGILVHNCRIKHAGHFPDLEDQMICMTSEGFTGSDASPDRVDALVWAITFLMLGKKYEQPDVIGMPFSGGPVMGAPRTVSRS